MARDKVGKLDALGRQMKTGSNFRADTQHEAYPRATLFRRRVAQYFDYCDEKKEKYTVPGLALFLGLRTMALVNYDPPVGMDEYRRINDFALQKIEAFTVGQLFETKGSTKGIEFLASNTLKYANKSEVQSKQTLEITEKEKIKQIPDSELNGRIEKVLPKLQSIIGGKN